MIIVRNLHYPSRGAAAQNRPREHGTVRIRDGRGRAHRSTVVCNPACKNFGRSFKASGGTGETP